MPKKPLCIAFLWHMHQPNYRHPQTGEMVLPWTRFHAVKDYYDMGALVQRVPGTHVTINVVPSLIDQLFEYGTGEARESYATMTLRDASQLSDFEKSFLLRRFFQLPPSHMVLPYSRYKELMTRRGSQDPQGQYSMGLQLFTVRDYRDLQMWYNLTWCGNTLRRDPEIAAFFEKGRDFTESDKKRLLEIQYSFIGRVVPFYKTLFESKTVELSASPYYHPILPLLCDLKSALEALPTIPLPSTPFSFPEDARQHIARAREAFENTFGCSARGMWPAEGAISDAALTAAQEEGVRWLATDEAVLWNSIKKEAQKNVSFPWELKFCAYRWGNTDTGPCLFFRDHALSDLIGFTYHQWDAEDAVSDFVRRLRNIHQSLPDNDRYYIVPVILDGENAWEHYPNNGTDFLLLLYERIAESGDLRTVTFSEYLDLEPYRRHLNSIVAGSWIYGNLATWIGQPAKNRAWEELGAARRLLKSSYLPCSPQQLNSAFREMMIAEGSDWFWWYGEDHPTENAAEFDELFRGRLKNVYRLMGEAVPPRLDEPIQRVTTAVSYRNPVHTITPSLDGRVTDYFEWLSAGYVVPCAGEAMCRTDRFLEKIFFGFDLKKFYLRIDLMPAKMREFFPARSVEVTFVFPHECKLALELKDQGIWDCRVIQWPSPDLAPGFAGDKILELAIPLDALGVKEPMDVKFFLSVREEGRELERFPLVGFWTAYTDPWNLDQHEWIV